MRARRKRIRYIRTPLEAFLRIRKIRPAVLARESGRSRQYLLKIRNGRIEPTRPAIEDIVRACRRLTSEPVLAGQLFNLGDTERAQLEVDRKDDGTDAEG